MEEKETNAVELQVRRILAQEAGEYREFLQRQFRFITWSAGVLIVVAGGAFSYLIGDSLKSIDKEMRLTVEDKMVKYRIVEEYKKELDTLLEIAVKDELKDPNTIKKINELIGLESKKTVVKEIIEKTALPPGTVLAFDRDKCPDGWTQFAAANGRTIIGAGPKSKETSQRKVGDQGGAETHALTVEELPKHDHNAKGSLSGGSSVTSTGISTGLSWYSKNKEYRLPTEDVDKNSKTPDFWSDGGNKPHENMPPYFVLLYCTKNT